MHVSKISAGFILSINLLASSALAQPPSQFSYGCGSGCFGTAKLISPIKVHRLSNGTATEYRVGTFLDKHTEMKGRKGRKGITTTALQYVVADCKDPKIVRLKKLPVFSRNSIKFSEGEYIYWQKIYGNYNDSNGSSSGGGYYFDLLCKNPN
jgi:hypothetical protein